MSLATSFLLVVLVSPGSSLQDSSPVAATRAERVRNANAFAFDLFQQLSTAEGNVLLSPASLSEGGDDEGHSLSMANRLWGSSRESSSYYQEPFLATMRDFYGAGFEAVDFVDEPRARRRINGWVADATHERIPELIPSGVLDRLTVLVLTSAIHFQGTWKWAFDPEHTKVAPFFVKPDQSVPVPMMYQMAMLPHARVGGATLLELPYAGDAASMLVVLPDPDRSPDSIAASLGAETLERWRAELRETDLLAHLPRLRLSQEYELAGTVLPAMGMRAPFAFSRDWAPLNGGVEELRITHVLHEAFVAVDEQGTEAAAASGVVIKKRGRPTTFRADRPFLFLIQDRRTGLVLFLGRVTDPSLGAGG